MRPKKILFSVDDGHLLDERMAALLDKYQIPGIFFWPVDSDIMKHKVAKKIAKFFTIGGHTWSHPKLTDIDDEVWLEHEIGGAREFMQKKFDQPIDWFCYPKGYRNQAIIDMVEKAGYSFARTVEVGVVTRNQKALEMGTAVHIYQRKEYDRDWLEYGKLKYVEACHRRGIFHAWGHSWEIERDGNWEKLEELLKFIAE